MATDIAKFLFVHLRSLCKLKKRVATKLKNPRLRHIHFHRLRHWKATMEYHDKKDIRYVMRLLGHRNIQSTLVYTQLVSFEGDEYSVKVTKTADEVCELAEAGFNYLMAIEDLQIFRKKK